MKYIGQAAIAEDIANFKAALAGLDVKEAYLPAITPGSVEHWLRNDHYKTDEEFIHNLGEALHEEYKAITDAGITLQLDVPNLPDGWQMFPEMDVADYRKYAAMRVEALNLALRDIPEDLIRVHICWGSGHHPHKHDLPLKDIVDIVFDIKGQSYSVEGANPAHEHEWQVFEDFKLPEGKVLIPGVVGHYTDYLEHPDLVAQRLVRFAGLVGRENVVAGTDCGLGPRVGHPNIAWAKLESLVEGARRASAQLWS
jgi:5-methyltetrahydropteroyltriglutamate--homocysteine methyltransferase